MKSGKSVLEGEAVANMLPSGIVISEILVDPNGTLNFDTDGNGTAAEVDEYVELSNASGAANDFSGLQLWDMGVGNCFNFPTGTMLQASGSLRPTPVPTAPLSVQGPIARRMFDIDQVCVPAKAFKEICTIFDVSLGELGKSIGPASPACPVPKGTKHRASSTDTHRTTVPLLQRPTSKPAPEGVA